MSDGLVAVPWMDVFGRTVSDKKRGKLLGHQQLFGGIGALAAGFIIKTTLEQPYLSYGLKYSIISTAMALRLLSPEGIRQYKTQGEINEQKTFV